MTYSEMREQLHGLQAQNMTMNTILWLVVQHHGKTLNPDQKPTVENGAVGAHDCALVIPHAPLPKDTIAKVSLEQTKDGLKITACKIV